MKAKVARYSMLFLLLFLEYLSCAHCLRLEDLLPCQVQQPPAWAQPRQTPVTPAAPYHMGTDTTAPVPSQEQGRPDSNGPTNAGQLRRSPVTGTYHNKPVIL